MISLEPQHYEIVKTILGRYPYSFYAFGSRVRGTNKLFSDLDLLYIESIPIKILINIEEDFEESDLPFKVDLISWNEISDNFKQLIKNDLVLFQDGKKISQFKNYLY